MYSLDDTAKAFRLLGNFAGDDELVDEIKWCQEVSCGVSITENNNNFKRLLSLLERLPHPAQRAVTTQILAISPCCDEILRRLFDFCVNVGSTDDNKGGGEGRDADDGDESFVVLLTDSTRLIDSNRCYHILQMILVLLSFASPEVAAEISRQYLRSASLRYQSQFLVWATKRGVGDGVITDDELWEFYQNSPGRTQKEVLKTCRTMATTAVSNSDNGKLESSGCPPHPREEFLRKVIEETKHDPSLVFWCSTAYLEERMLLGRAEHETFLRDLGLRRWKYHGRLYLKFIRSRLRKEKSALARGTVWERALVSALPGSSASDLQPYHIKELMMLLSSKEYPVLSLDNGSFLPQNVRVYLEEKAANGDDISMFEGVHTVTLSDEYLRIIPKKERIQRALAAIDALEWDEFQKYQNVVRHDHLPFERTFQNASVDDLWSVISAELGNEMKRSRGAGTEKGKKKFLHYFSFADFTGSKRLSFTIDALWEWQQWHLRSTPDRMTLEQRGRIGRLMNLNVDHLDEEPLCEILWEHWYGSLTSRYYGNNLVRRTSQSAMEAQRSHRLTERSRITLIMRFAHELLDLSVEGMASLPSGSVSQSTIIEHLQDSLELYRVLDDSASPVVLHNFHQRMSQTLIQEFVPRLAELLQFDPKTTDTYGSALDSFRTHTTWLAGCMLSSSCRPVMSAFLDEVLEKVFSKATANDHHLALPNRQSRFETISSTDVEENTVIKFVYYNSQMHLDAIRQLENVLTTMLRLTKKVDGLRGEQSSSWNLLLRASNATQKDVADTSVEGVHLYLNKCKECLPQWLLKEQRGTIVSRVVKFAEQLQNSSHPVEKVRASMTGLAADLHYLDILSDTLESIDVFEEDDRTAIVLETGGFQYEAVREALKKGTIGVDGMSRACGQVAWLRAAADSDDLTYLADALEYTAGRIRNEAGLYRREVFDHVAADLRTQVRKSLDEPSEENLTAVKRMTTKLVGMLKNDLSRRDSIGRLGGFKGLPTNIMDLVMRHESGSSVKELRQAWISFAIQIHWLQTQAGLGENGLMTYRFQSAHKLELKGSTLIAASSFDAIYLRQQASNQIAMLKQRVNLLTAVVDSVDDYFSPEQCVSCLSNALSEVWDPKFKSQPFGWTGAWAPSNTDATQVFDRTFANLKDAPEHHYKFASDLLENVLQIYYADRRSQDELKSTYFFEIPRLANVLDETFRYAVKNDLKKFVEKWYKLWCHQLLERGTRDWKAIASMDDKPLMSFLAKHSKGCEPPACCVVIDNTDVLNRKVVLARELLALNPSAIMTPEVQEALESERQDIVSRLLRVGNKQSAGPLEGPFANKEKTDHETLLYNWLRPSVLASFSPSISRHYAAYALSLASNPSSSVAKRVEAIENFVSAPTTGHQEVMRALQDNGIDEPIEEAIIIKVFSLDSPWHVVSFLLNAGLVDKQHQRMTATLLDHVAKYVQAEKVIEMLGMLLDETRRSKLGMQLQKAIIRMLFNNRCPRSTELLENEWERDDLHVELRHVLVELCVDTVAGTAATSASGDWEWKVLEALAQAKDTPKEILLYLFKPSWGPYDAWSIYGHLFEAETDEVLLYFKGKTAGLGCLPVMSDAFRQRYYKLMSTLEGTLSQHRGWKAMIRGYRLSFAVRRNDDENDDQVVVDEMKEFFLRYEVDPEELQQPGDVGIDGEDGKLKLDDVEKFQTIGMAKLFARICGSTLLRDLRKAPEKALGDVCHDNVTAAKFRACFHHLITLLLDLPPRQALRRARVVLALSEMVHEFERATGHRRELWKALVAQRFKREISLITKDANIISSELRSLLG